MYFATLFTPVGASLFATSGVWAAGNFGPFARTSGSVVAACIRRCNSTGQATPFLSQLLKVSSVVASDLGLAFVLSKPNVMSTWLIGCTRPHIFFVPGSEAPCQGIDRGRPGTDPRISFPEFLKRVHVPLHSLQLESSHNASRACLACRGSLFLWGERGASKYICAIGRLFGSLTTQQHTNATCTDQLWVSALVGFALPQPLI